jgi:hypothetical protein
VEIRDEHVLAQGRLTLPAVAPEPVAEGRWVVHAAWFESNSFSWAQDRPGESPRVRRFLVDGETATLALGLDRGLGPDLDAGLRLPVRWRGGGWMDVVIDTWHRWGGLPDGDRPAFRRDAFRVEGRTAAGRPFSWNAAHGAGLGLPEAVLRWRLVDRDRDPWSVALVLRAQLPLGTGPYADDGAAGGAQLVAAHRLAGPLDLVVGAGATAQDPGPVRGIRYVPARGQAFLALEWRLSRGFALSGRTDYATRLVDDVDGYPGRHWTGHLTGRIALGERHALDLGFTENFIDQMSTTDFGIHAAVTWRP